MFNGYNCRHQVSPLKYFILAIFFKLIFFPPHPKQNQQQEHFTGYDTDQNYVNHVKPTLPRPQIQSPTIITLTSLNNNNRKAPPHPYHSLSALQHRSSSRYNYRREESAWTILQSLFNKWHKARLLLRFSNVLPLSLRHTRWLKNKRWQPRYWSFLRFLSYLFYIREPGVKN